MLNFLNIYKDLMAFLTSLMAIQLSLLCSRGNKKLSLTQETEESLRFGPVFYLKIEADLKLRQRYNITLSGF